ncbi:hypothetical protein KBD49_09530 [Myxococcota bacterium]|nr:hypothetical protein [Myxococcota bacterium]
MGNPAPSFNNNGDPNYNSGALSRIQFDFRNGATISADFLVQSNPVGCWTGAATGIATGEPADYGNTTDAWMISGIGFDYIGDACWGDPPAQRRHGVIYCWIIGKDGTREEYYRGYKDAFLDAWHRVSVEVSAGGVGTCYLDGTRLASSSGVIDVSSLNTKRIYLGLRSGTYGKALIDNLVVQGCLGSDFHR